MKKRIELVQLKDGKQAVKCTALTVLTGDEHEKLNTKALRARINSAAKGCNLQWGLESNGNIDMLLTSRIMDNVFGDTEMHDLDMATTTFMSAIDAMDIPPVPTFDEAQGSPAPEGKIRIDEDDIHFIEGLLDDWDGKDSNVSITGFAPVMKPSNYTRIIMGEFFIPEHVAREMCRLFLKEYAHAK